jgi:hypothetical protein
MKAKKFRDSSPFFVFFGGRRKTFIRKVELKERNSSPILVIAAEIKMRRSL